MSYIIKPIYKDIDPNKPFAQDSYEREKFAVELTNIFRKIDSEFVVSIDANWGQGKTTFIKMWEQYLKNQEDVNFIPIYYDAFKNDFTDDVFLSIAALIYKNLDPKTKNNKRNTKQKDKFKKKIIEVGKDSLLLGLKSAVNVATAGLGGDIAKNAAQKLLFGSLEIKEKFEAHLRIEKDIEDYRNCLREVIEKSGENSKIVFFIDELDRCRPTFTIEVIEKIKHFFNIPNVIFVLAVNQIQLNRIITNVYGINEADAKIYFEKFIDLKRKLPTTKAYLAKGSLDEDGTYQNTHGRFKAIIEQSSSLENNLSDIINHSLDDFIKFADNLALSPRDLEKSFAVFAMIISDNNEKVLVKDKEDYLFAKTILLQLMFKKARPQTERSTFINASILQRQTAVSPLKGLIVKPSEAFAILNKYL